MVIEKDGEGHLDHHVGKEVLHVGSNITGTDFFVNKPHCAAAVRP